MRLLLFLLCFLLHSLATCFAGEIYGSITEGGKAVGAGLKVSVRCAKGSYPATTDNYGSYRLIAAEQGKCELRLEYKGQSPAIEVFSYAESARYDLIVESQKGSYLLKRK